VQFDCSVVAAGFDVRVGGCVVVTAFHWFISTNTSKENGDAIWYQIPDDGNRDGPRNVGFIQTPLTRLNWI